MRLSSAFHVLGFALVFGAATASASEVRVWGDTTQAPAGVFAVPAGLTTAVKISASPTHVLALTSAGAVVAWGDNSKGQCTVPPGATSNVTAIAAGYLYSLALRNDGTIVAWGDNTYNQISVPAGLTTVRSIHTDERASTAVLTDNTIRMWGNSAYLPPTGLLVVDAYPISPAGGVGIKADGTVTQWIDPLFTTFQPVPDGLVATSLTNGGGTSLAISAGGTVTQWGYTQSDNTAGFPSGFTNVVEASAGGFHCIARKADGTLVVWGSNAAITGIAPPSSWTNASALSANNNFTAGIFATAAVGSPPSNLSLNTQTVTFGTDIGGPVGLLTATDPDAGATFTYALVSGAGSTDNDLFSISGSTLTTAQRIAPAQDILYIRIRVRDQNGLSKDATFTLNITQRPTDDGDKKCGLGGAGVILMGFLFILAFRQRHVRIL